MTRVPISNIIWVHVWPFRMWLYKAVTVKIRTSGLITLAVSGTGTGTRTKTWTNGLYSFMSNLYRPQRSWAKVMFLQVCVILFTGGGCLPQCMLGYHPPPEQTPPSWSRPRPGSRHPPGSRPPGSRHPPRSRHPPPSRHTHPQEQTPPPPGSRLRHTVNERPVRILLECILVLTAPEQ